MTDELTNAFKAFEVEYEYGVKKSADTIRRGEEELASDKEWQRLKSAMRSRQDENTALRALVKEMANVLELLACTVDCDACDAMVGGRTDACREVRARHDALIAKAREVLK